MLSVKVLNIAPLRGQLWGNEREKSISPFRGEVKGRSNGPIPTGNLG